MSTLYERITELCKNKGVSGSRMCLDLGMSKSTMSELKAGRTKGISTSTAQKIAAYFGVSVDYLLGKDEKEKPAQESGTISIRSRDGSVLESELSDEQIETFKKLLNYLNDSDKDN